MPHKNTIAPTRRNTLRRAIRPFCIPHEDKAAREAEPQERQMEAAKPDPRDFVYAVKVEVRSPDTGHPLVEPSTLAVDELYSNEQKAIDKMQAIVKAAQAFELARSRNDPYSPAWGNVVPIIALNSPRLQVITAEGMIHQYFIDEMPLM